MHSLHLCGNNPKLERATTFSLAIYFFNSSSLVFFFIFKLIFVYRDVQVQFRLTIYVILNLQFQEVSIKLQEIEHK